MCKRHPPPPGGRIDVFAGASSYGSTVYVLAVCSNRSVNVMLGMFAWLKSGLIFVAAHTVLSLSDIRGAYM